MLSLSLGSLYSGVGQPLYLLLNDWASNKSRSTKSVAVHCIQYHDCQPTRMYSKMLISKLKRRSRPPFEGIQHRAITTCPKSMVKALNNAQLMTPNWLTVGSEDPAHKLKETVMDTQIGQTDMCLSMGLASMVDRRHPFILPFTKCSEPCSRVCDEV